MSGRICFCADMPIFPEEAPEIHRQLPSMPAVPAPSVRPPATPATPPLPSDAAQIAAAFGRDLVELHRLCPPPRPLTDAERIAAAFGNDQDALRRYG